MTITEAVKLLKKEARNGGPAEAGRRRGAELVAELAPKDKMRLAVQGLVLAVYNSMEGTRDHYFGGKERTYTVDTVPQGPKATPTYLVDVFEAEYVVDGKIKVVGEMTVEDCFAIAANERKLADGHYMTAQHFEDLGNTMKKAKVSKVDDLPRQKVEAIFTRAMEKAS